MPVVDLREVQPFPGEAIQVGGQSRLAAQRCHKLSAQALDADQHDMHRPRRPGRNDLALQRVIAAGEDGDGARLLECFAHGSARLPLGDRAVEGVVVEVVVAQRPRELVVAVSRELTHRRRRQRFPRRVVERKE